MAKQTTLKKIITKMSLLELVYTIFIFLILIVTFNLSIHFDVIYPANYPERQLSNYKERFLTGELTEQEIPHYYEYQFVENGNTRQTIPRKFSSSIRQAKQNGYSQIDSFIASKIFVHYRQGNRELVLSYRLAASFASEKLARILPPPEILSGISFFLLWIIGFLFIIRHYVSLLRFELTKVNNTNEEIKQMNLDYIRKNSRIKEVQGMLASLDNMSDQLKQALKNQWVTQQHQKELIQSVTHDIRTPITLIKGNLELLEEKQGSTEDNEQLEDLHKGVKRLEEYVEQLKIISGIIKESPKQEVINQVLLNQWVQLLDDLTKSYGMNYKIHKQEESSLFIAKEQMTTALQNIIVNSMEHSPPNSQIDVSFEDYPQVYQMIIKDQGTGFSEQALAQATKRYFSTRLNLSNNNYGLGLAIVEEILAANNGQLQLENIMEDGKIIGAKVTMSLFK